MRQHQKSWPAHLSLFSTVPSAAVITPLPVNRFPNKLAPNVPNNILRNPFFKWLNYFYGIIHFLIRNFNVAIPDRNIFLWIAASVADLAVVDCNGIETLLASG